MLHHYTDMYQWYKINTNEIFEDHKLALSNDPTVLQSNHSQD